MGRDCSEIARNIQYKDSSLKLLSVIFPWKSPHITLQGMVHPASIGTTFCPCPS